MSGLSLGADFRAMNEISFTDRSPPGRQPYQPPAARLSDSPTISLQFPLPTASGWTVMTFVTMTSAAFIVLLRFRCALQNSTSGPLLTLICINALITILRQYFFI